MSNARLMDDEMEGDELMKANEELIQTDGYLDLIDECFDLNRDFSSFASTLIFVNVKSEKGMDMESFPFGVSAEKHMERLLLDVGPEKQIESLLLDVECLMKSVMCELEDNVKLKTQVKDINEHITSLDDRLLELESKQNQLEKYNGRELPEMFTFPLTVNNTILQNTVIKIKTNQMSADGETNLIKSFDYRLPQFPHDEATQKRKKLTVRLTIRKFAEKLRENIKW